MTKSVAEEVLPILREAHLVLQKAGIYDKVLAFLQRKNAYPIVILGASGTGKTALLRSLAGLQPSVRREDRTDEVTPAKQKLGEAYLEIIDTPGETEHKTKRDAFFRELNKKKSIGVINVVSYGYHEGKAPLATAIDGERASTDFLGERRKIELALLKEWVGPICGKGGCVSWVVTVVTKADLWWEPGPDQSVLKYYGENPYLSAFSASDDVPHSVRSYSSLNHLFYDRSPMSGYYSDTRREEDHIALVAHLLSKASEHG